MTDGARESDDEPPREPTDDALLAASAAGDQHAFGVLVRRHVRSATALAFDLLDDLDEAEDVVQDAYLVVLRRATAFDATMPFAPWLFGIVRNAARRRLERASRRRRLLQLWWRPAHAVSPAASADETDAPILARVDHIVCQLPEMQRRCFTLQITHSVPVGDIAAMFGIAESMVRQHVFRARATLRERLGDLPRD